jgi:acyl carrier protein
VTEVFDSLSCLIAETFGVPRESIDAEARWTDFEHDSLDLVELVIAIQEEFDIHLEPDELRSMETVADLARLVESKLT